MDEKLDKLLKRTLTLTDEPSSGLNRRILDLADTAVENGLALGQTDTTARKEQLLRQRGLALKPTGKRAGKSAWATRRLAAAALTAMLLAGGSLSALAAWKFLSPQAAAEHPVGRNLRGKSVRLRTSIRRHNYAGQDLCRCCHRHLRRNSHAGIPGH